MKKLLFITILFLSTGMFFYNFAPGVKLVSAWPCSGNTLTYHLENEGTAYDFIVSELVMDKNISFRWKMTEPANITGTVKINKKALDKATNLVDEFSDLSALVMDNETTVWVSRKIYKSLKTPKPITVKFDGKAETLTFKSNEKLKVKVNEGVQEVNVLYVESDKGHQLWILDNDKNPLLIKMQLGFTIELVKVATK